MTVFKDDDKNVADEQNETMWLICPYDVFDYDSSLVCNSFLCEMKNSTLAHLIKYHSLVSTENTWKKEYPWNPIRKKENVTL